MAQTTIQGSFLGDATVTMLQLLVQRLEQTLYLPRMY